MMPCNVSTCWNSTFDMLHFAINFHPAMMTAKCNLDLHKYELSPEVWHIAKELQDVLGVSLSYFFSVITIWFLEIFKDATLFFSCGTPNLASHPSHGPHWQYSGHQVQFFSVFSSYSSHSGCWQEHNQLVLQQDRSFGSLSHCHG